MNNTIYTRVVFITIGLIILNQCFIQYWLFQKTADASIINVSGRQRMLSQRLVNLTDVHRDDPSSISLKEINEVFESWEHTHYKLIEECKPSIFGNLFGKNVSAQLEQLNPQIEYAKKVILSSTNLTEEDFKAFRENQDQFLFSMNENVNELERQSYKKLQIIIITEILFALFSLFMVYYEVIYVFGKITQSLQQKNEDLEESNELLEQYAYLAAHDLRSPSQNLLNFSTLLQSKTKDKLDLQESNFLTYIITSAKRLIATTDDLLRFSSYSHKQLEITEINVPVLVENVLTDLRVDIESKNAMISIGELPTSIRGEKSMIHSVFQNLLSNAIKFVDAAKTPQIEVRYKEIGQEHIFIIHDNGIGIAPEYQEQIFDLFCRLNDKEKFSGTGIGLAICKKIVYRHGGKIWLESEVGKGSVFSFSIPFLLKKESL